MRADIIVDVENELHRQDILWGPPHEQTQNKYIRISILAEEFGEYAKASLDRESPEDIYKELVQVAAVAIANAQRIKAGLDCS